jgi:hypothetical protein
MTSLSRGKTSAILLLVCCFGFLGVRSTRAEIATGGDQGHASLIKLSIIVEDPDPIGDAWHRFSGDSASHFVLNDVGEANGDGEPTFLINPVSGLPIVAWAMNSPQGYDVVVSHFSAGAWSVPQVLAGSPADELDPFLLADPQDGTVHLFYWIHDASPRVMHRQAPADLSTWSLPQQVSQPSEIALRPAVVFHQGVLSVVYEVHDFGFGAIPRQIVLATHDGVDFSASSVALSVHAGPNWPQVHSRKGKLWVDWIDGDDAVNWRRRSQSGSWDPVQAEGFSGIEDRDYHVRARVKIQALD